MTTFVRRHTSTLLCALALSLALTSCATVQSASPTPAGLHAAVSDRLFFGRSMPGGGSVSEQDWRDFLRDVVTPRFPNGLTVWHAEGQWRDASGAVVREESFVLELVHMSGEAVERSIAVIIELYKERFRQESVMRVRSGVMVGF